MFPHTRAMIAAATFAFVTGKKVAGLFDHTARKDLRIAAECRDDRLQGFDGDRDVRFGGTLPEIFDAGDKTYVSFTIEDGGAKGHDRFSSGDFSARVSGGLVQVYDHAQGAWFAYDIQDPDAEQSYYRTAPTSD